MPENILDKFAGEVFEDVERQLKRTIEDILNIPVSIGVPDAKWKKKYGFPMGAVMIDNGDIVDWIEDGNPESTREDGDKIILEYAVAEAAMILSFHLATKKRIILHRLFIKFLKGMRALPCIGENKEYRVGKISFKNVLPEPEGERVFEKIISIPLSGTLTETVITEKGTVEYQGNVSEFLEVLEQ